MKKLKFFRAFLSDYLQKIEAVLVLFGSSTKRSQLSTNFLIKWSPPVADM